MASLAVFDPASTDDPASMALILNIVHCRFGQVPHNLSISEIARLGKCADEYNMLRILRTFAKAWLEPHKHDSGSLKADVKSFILAGWYLGDIKMFEIGINEGWQQATVHRRAQGPQVVDINGLAFVEWFPDEDWGYLLIPMTKARATVIKRILQLLKTCLHGLKSDVTNQWSCKQPHGGRQHACRVATLQSFEKVVNESLKRYIMAIDDVPEVKARDKPKRRNKDIPSVDTHHDDNDSIDSDDSDVDTNSEDEEYWDLLFEKKSAVKDATTYCGSVRYLRELLQGIRIEMVDPSHAACNPVPDIKRQVHDMIGGVGNLVTDLHRLQMQKRARETGV